MQTQPAPLVSIIVLNWNGRRFLQRCLTSLWSQTFRDFEVVLVDNGSRDGSVSYVREVCGDWLKASASSDLASASSTGSSDASLENYIEGSSEESSLEVKPPTSLPRLRLVELAENQGFSGGNLAGLARCDPTSRWIGTLNNDTWAEADWLAGLVEAAEGAEQIWGTVCGPMLFASQAGQAHPRIASAGIEVARNGLATDRNLGQPLTSEEEPLEIFGPCAGAALYRRAALAQVGFFDPAFFAYLEDADLAWRLRLAGWRTLYLPQARVWHEYSGTGGQGSPFKNFQLGRNRLWVILKNWPAGLLWRHGWRILAYDLAASAYTLLKGQPHSLRGRLAALHPRHLARLRRQRRQIQAGRIVPLADLERWLQPSTSASATLRQRRAADDLAATPL